MNPEVPQSETVENSMPHTETKRRFPVFLIPFLLLLLLLVAGTYFIYGNFSLPGEKHAGGKVVTPTDSPTTTPLRWTSPKNYLATDSSSNIVLGSLSNGQSKVIVKAVSGPFGAPQFQSLATRSGTYFLYTKLPDTIITELQKNPPYEFYGSNDNELHLVTIGKDGSVKDVIADTNVSVGAGASLIAFDSEEKGFYYPKYENEKDVSYYFSLADSSKKLSELPQYLQSSAALSPDRKRYVLLDAMPKDNSDTGINSTYTLSLFSVSGKKEKTLYKDFISGETSVIFPTENSVFLAREDYVDGPQSVCYIEQIQVNTAKVTPLRAQECPPGSSSTNFHDLSLSPDRKFLLALYSQDSPGEQTRLGSFFVVDLKSGASQSLAEADEWYGKYFWIDQREVLTTITRDQKPIVYRLNLSTGEASVDDMFTGKLILAAF
ncbi:MAG: hypothetical protein RLZZ455_164 [Candidatus Parcubacteria bacterium]|jgi:hypothetical protein